MTRFVHLLLACSLLTLAAPSPAQAAVAPAPAGTITFEAIDGVTTVEHTYLGVGMIIEGLVSGEAEAREVSFRFWHRGSSGPSSNAESSAFEERCTKLALLVQSKPGRYALEIKVDASNYAAVTSCKLKSR